MNQIKKKLIIAAWIIIIQDNKILLVKRPTDTKLFPNAWTFPWWKLEENETLEKCATRECEEEAKITPQNLEKYSFYEYNTEFSKTISHLFTWNIDSKAIENDNVKWFWIDDLENIEIAFWYKELIKSKLNEN
jgi:mutator protein MutT